MTFKELTAMDNQNIFLNVNEFGELHIVNGKRMLVVIDCNELLEREKRYRARDARYAEGMFLKEILIYVREDEFGSLPKVGSMVKFDGKSYEVKDAINEDGIFSLTLEAKKT